jgi:hypothetical protein
VALDDLWNILRGDLPVPDSLRIDDDGRTVLALVETPSPIGPDLSLQPTCRQLPLPLNLEASQAVGIARPSWVPRWSLVGADEEMMLEVGHGDLLAITSR